MARRSAAMFSLSLLDLLTGALGAIIFLFIITPKGGQSAAQNRQAVIYFDTTQMKIHGALPDSLLYKQAGDTLFAVLLDYKDLPLPKKKSPKVISIKERVPSPPTAVAKPPKKTTPLKINQPKEPAKPEATKVVKVPEKPSPEKAPVPSVPTYKGSPPAVPCMVSIEVYWPNKTENVDLFVCKDGSCVYGARKRDKKIGQWDSGKSRNRIFNNDLRTNQEAVRQFDQILPGKYKVYAQYKESKSNKSSLLLKGLIYTKNKAKQERGEAFNYALMLNKKQRTLIGELILKSDGSFQFLKK